MKNMSRANKIAIAFYLVAGLVFGAAIVYGIVQGGGKASPAEAAETVVRDDSHRLSTADDGKVTLVEFLDFECEACGAAYPFVEQLRQRYEGRVTFVARYYPIPSHRNALNAAYAVEAAARQDRFEDMYKRMFETQPEWGESQESKADLFRTFAEDLGLDMDHYDADVASDAVKNRVQRDIDDGTKLGVSGTPTFFLNGQKMAPRNQEEFITTIEQALAE